MILEFITSTDSSQTSNMTVVIRLVLFSMLALSCHSDENEPCQLSDCGPHSCRTKQSGDTCYYVIYKASTFEEAQDACRDVGMTLATPIAAPVPDDVITGLLSIHGAWLNGIAKNLNKWTFTNGKTMIMSGSESDCGTMFSRYNWGESGRVDYFFRARPCYEPNKFLCRKDNCSPLTKDCIIHEPSLRLDWFKARDYCLKRNADIFYLNEDESTENMAVAFNWDYHDVGNIFVGLRERAWVWAVDSEDGVEYVDMKRTGWKSNEPNRGYKNCIKLQYTGTWDDQECSKTGPFPLCTREAVPLEDPAAESTTEYSTTPFDDQPDEKTTTQKIEIKTILQTTTLDTTTGFANTVDVGNNFGKEMRYTTDGATSKSPSDNDDYIIATTMLPEVESTNIPKSSAVQTTINPTTLRDIFEEEIAESTIPDSTVKPGKSENSENTSPNLVETVETKVVTVRGTTVRVITTRGPPTKTTPPGGKLEDEEIDDKGALKTITKFVLYKLMSSSAPTDVPYLFDFIITLVVILKDLFN